jgi:ribulose-phosphate 3-epimerase
VSEIASVLPEADMALVMSINAGFGGQAFNESALSKLDEIRSLPGGEDILLQIDGGINASTIKAATDHGTQLLVVGSAIFKQDDYAKAIENMMTEVTAS